MGKVKFVLEGTHSISCMAIATEVRSLQHVFTVPSPRAWGNEKFVRSGFHTCSSIIKDVWMYFLPAPICSYGDIETMQSSIASKRLRGHRSHQPPLNTRLKGQIAEWRAQNCAAQPRCSENQAYDILPSN